MSEATDQTGKVVEYDEQEKYGYIDFKYNGKRVYLPHDQALDLGQDLDDGLEVTFDIMMVGTEPHATNVKRK